MGDSAELPYYTIRSIHPTRSPIAWISTGPTRQHPPTSRAPPPIHSVTSSGWNPFGPVEVRLLHPSVPRCWDRQ